MVPHETVIFFFCLSFASTSSIEHDFRFISFQDLQQSLKLFSQHEVVSYSQMLFDVARNQVLVGARNFLFRLSLPNLELIESSEWLAAPQKRIQCIDKGQSDESCHNFIKILLTNGKHLFACGTNAFSPQCSKRKIENITDVVEWVEGLAKCSPNPNANITGFMSEGGEYYFGGPTDFSNLNYLISKSIGTDTILRTVQYDIYSLNEPQFVGSFETDHFVYFLFREAALEYMNCGKAIYSRIARVCKNDTGGRVIRKDNWMTFFKARLNCSITGEYPFYFNEIQSMSYVADENIVYATFSTPPNSIEGSAICAFNLSSIERAFDGPLKHQANSDSEWRAQQVPKRDSFSCHSIGTSASTKDHLMDGAVQSTTLNPLHVARLERFTYITVDVVPTKLHRAVHIIYVATTENFIKKISVLPRTQESCVVEVWQSSPFSPIRSIQFVKAYNSVFVSTETELMKINADNCPRHTSKESCLNSMDPYCGWNERIETCSTAPNSDPLDNYWSQAVTSCPILDAIVDGGWSSWSSWTPCDHHGGDTTDQCLCQTRECNNPAPKNGLPCEGPSISVTNCTIHGGWSNWSAWSGCSATCGNAVKTRTRTCTNPAPAHGGRVCVGQDNTIAPCTAELPPCPAVAKDGAWSDWSHWDDCFHIADGCKKRVRKCDNPRPENGGQFCVGNDVEFLHIGLEEHKNTSTSPWISFSNSTGDFRSRFLIICKAPSRRDSIKISIKEETCGKTSCSVLKKVPPKWNPWESWSECSVPCGGGTQSRVRYCLGIDCKGSNEETRDCNTHQCPGQWSCWSDWSPCNVSCGWGVKSRHRDCLTFNCSGSAWDKEPCSNDACDSPLGWGNWTEWSLCDENFEQHRKRHCRTKVPGANMCKGNSMETRMCVPNQYNTLSSLEQQYKLASTEGAILFFIMGLAFGLGLGGLAVHIYHKKKRNRIPSSPLFNNAKQNPYIAMPLRERPKKPAASALTYILNNGTLKSKHNDYESGTLKRNSNAVTDVIDDKFFYD